MDGITHREIQSIIKRGPIAMLARSVAAAMLGFLLGTVCAGVMTAQGAELFVATDGNDANPGTQSAPLRTIQRAADLTQPGDVVTVHRGVYRERIKPPRGGLSDQKRIVYQAAAGEKVDIKGSERVKTWGKVQDDVWKVVIPNAFFGGFNPYGDLIHGDWFDPKGRRHHTGAVYLNGDWLVEAARLDDVLKLTGTAALWFGQVDGGNTTIWAQFKGVNPNEQLVEINVRRTVFYPEKPGVNYITVRGFTLCHAATPWAPPTAEQIGLIGTHWSKGWIIENNVISHSVCSGVALGKHGDQWDNTSANTAEGYVKTIERAFQNGWSKEAIGHHVVRNNTISHCEQTGVVGSLGAVFSTITGNHIHDIHVRRLFSGAEMAGIKLHGAIDVLIAKNHIHHTTRGVWLDWMAQGARVSRNLFHDNREDDLFVEVDHGPFVVDNNIFLSPRALLVNSQGGAYVHNLIAGVIHVHPFDARLTPFHRPHSTTLGGMHDNPCGDDRYYNNIFVGGGLSAYNKAQLPVRMGGNVFLKRAVPCKYESNPLCEPKCDPAISLMTTAEGCYLGITLAQAGDAEHSRRLVTSELLGKTAISKCSYENPDGSPLRIDTDFFGKRRNEANPTAGPFENPGAGALRLKVCGGN
jgi:alpha-L-arabinofuranosidase